MKNIRSCCLCENYKTHPCACTHCEDYDEFDLSQGGRRILDTFNSELAEIKIDILTEVNYQEKDKLSSYTITLDNLFGIINKHTF